MNKRINIAIAAAALSTAPTQAQTGWTIYAPGQAPTDNAVALYGEAKAVAQVERAAEALGWTVADEATASSGQAFAVIKSPIENRKGQQIWQAARDAGVAIGPLLQRERKSPPG